MLEATSAWMLSIGCNAPGLSLLTKDHAWHLPCFWDLCLVSPALQIVCSYTLFAWSRAQFCVLEIVRNWVPLFHRELVCCSGPLSRLFVQTPRCSEQASSSRRLFLTPPHSASTGNYAADCVDGTTHAANRCEWQRDREEASNNTNIQGRDI